jgi:DNA-binding LacI/PurR family transcriptional regulator
MAKKSKKITIAELARQMGVSPATVSVCLSGQAEKYQIKPETCAAVKDYARYVGYVPDPVARRLRVGGSAPVGILFYQNIRAGEKSFPSMNLALNELQNHGRETRLIGDTSVQNGLNTLAELGCREVILLNTFSPADEEKLTIPAGLKIYAADYIYDGTPVKPREELIRMGISLVEIHHRLARTFIDAGLGPIMCNHWRGSYRMADAGLVPSEDYLLHVDTLHVYRLFETGISYAHRFLELRRDKPIGTVMLGDDRIAAGFIAELLKNGVRVPADVQVLSFDNLEMAAYLAVPLTTLGSPILNHTNLALDAIIRGKEIPAVTCSKAEISWRDSARLPDRARESLSDILQT